MMFTVAAPVWAAKHSHSRHSRHADKSGPSSVENVLMNQQLLVVQQLQSIAHGALAEAPTSALYSSLAGSLLHVVDAVQPVDQDVHNRAKSDPLSVIVELLGQVPSRHQLY